MSKKKIALIIIGLFILIGIIGSSGKENKKDSSLLEEQKQEVQKPEENQKVKEVKEEEKKTAEQKESPKPVVQEKKKYAVLSGIDNDPKSDAYGEIVIQEINVWEEAGSGEPNNVAVGRIPHDTAVEVLESKDIEGNTFYKIRSSIGKVSVLPTNFNLRKNKMEELPESEWFVPADETFPVEGWVIDSFVTEITEE